MPTEMTLQCCKCSEIVLQVRIKIYYCCYYYNDGDDDDDDDEHQKNKNK